MAKRCESISGNPEGGIFEYPTKKVNKEESAPRDIFMVIDPEKGVSCLECEFFEKCSVFTEMSRKYSANQVNMLAKKTLELIEDKKDSMLFRFFK